MFYRFSNKMQSEISCGTKQTTAKDIFKSTKECQLAMIIIHITLESDIQFQNHDCGSV